jgi:hypothetical protein
MPDEWLFLVLGHELYRGNDAVGHGESVPLLAGEFPAGGER